MKQTLEKHKARLVLIGRKADNICHRTNHHFRKAAEEHKHGFLSSLSIAVLAMHWINPEFEAIAFAIAGIIAAEMA